MILVESVIEFDIAQCNINVMYQNDLISKAKYEELTSKEKYERLVAVGLIMTTDDYIRENLKVLIKGYVDDFIRSNNIDPLNIIEIANDAVWVTSVYPHKTRFGEYINFIAKRKATVMMTIGKYCFYYNSLTDEFFTRFLGQESSIELTPFLEVIKNILEMYESRSEEKLYNYIHKTIRAYALGETPKSYRIDIVSKLSEKNSDPKDDSNFKFLLRVLNEIYTH